MAQGFSSSTHTIAHNYLLLQFQGIGYPFLAFMAMAHMVYTMQVNTHYIKLNFGKNGVAHFLSQHSGGRGRWAVEAGLVYKVNPWQPVLHRETLSQKAEQNIYMHLYLYAYTSGFHSLHTYYMWGSISITPVLGVKHTKKQEDREFKIFLDYMVCQVQG